MDSAKVQAVGSFTALKTDLRDRSASLATRLGAAITTVTFLLAQFSAAYMMETVILEG